MGRKFKDEDDLISSHQNFFDSKPNDFCASGIYDLPRRWRDVICTKGEYIIDKYFFLKLKKGSIQYFNNH